MSLRCRYIGNCRDPNYWNRLREGEDPLATALHLSAAGNVIDLGVDALLEDAEQVGLDGICEVIDNGGAFVGSHLELVSAGIEPVGHSLCSAPCRAHQRNRLPFAREAESFSQFVLRSRNAASDAAYDQTQQAQTNQ